MIRIAVCDDELRVLEAIMNLLLTYMKNKNIELQVIPFNNPKLLLEEEERYDIILMDVNLGEGNGIEVAKKIRRFDKSVKIIFITAFTQYMSRAFDVHAFGYLTKPVRTRELFDIINDAIAYSEKEEEISVKFHVKNKVLNINVHEISYFEYCNRAIIIHTLYHSKIEIPGEKISNIATQMKKFHFEVPHKSFVVNLDNVDYIKGYVVYMQNGDKIPLSQLNSKNFRKCFQDYIKTQI